MLLKYITSQSERFMSKELCKLKKQLNSDLRQYALLVNQPRFVCKKCGRAANNKKNVCSPIKLSGKV
jgi:hypothetical protein